MTNKTTLTNVAEIVSIMVNNGVPLPLNVSFGSIYAEPEYFLNIESTDLVDATYRTLDKHAVMVTAKIAESGSTKYVLQGEWNAIESFLSSTVTDNRYIELMNRMEEMSEQRGKF